MQHQLLRYETLLSSGGKVVLPEFGDLSSTLDVAAASPLEQGVADDVDGGLVGDDDGGSGGEKMKGRKKLKRNKRKRDQPMVVAGVVIDNGAILEALAKSIDTVAAAATPTGSRRLGTADAEMSARNSAAGDVPRTLVASEGCDESATCEAVGAHPTQTDQPLAGNSNDAPHTPPVDGEGADLDVSVDVDAQDTLPTEGIRSASDRAVSPHGDVNHETHADTDAADAAEGSPPCTECSDSATTVAEATAVTTKVVSEEDSEAEEGDADERYLAKAEARRHPSFTRLQSSYISVSETAER